MLQRQEDVIYGRKFGTALTMDILRPAEGGNGIGLIFAVSGGWRSSHAAIDDYMPVFLEPLVRRGYTVFAVVPGSQPRFTIPEILEDMHTAVRHIRYHARDYGIDADRLGMYGGSAGGHLSLMVGFSGGPGNENSELPEERVSSRVQAVAEFYAPTDFFNYGDMDMSALGCGILEGYKAPFDFHEFDETSKMFVRVTDPARYEEIGRSVSPITHVNADSPPTLLIHGDADELVPIQQSQLLARALEEAGVPHRFITVPGGAHSWPDMSSEVQQIADWFDAHLAPSEPRCVGCPRGSRSDSVG